MLALAVDVRLLLIRAGLSEVDLDGGNSIPNLSVAEFFKRLPFHDKNCIEGLELFSQHRATRDNLQFKFICVLIFTSYSL